MTVNPDQKMERETQQEPPKDKGGEEKHGISEKSYSPPLSPLVFPQNQYKSPSLSPPHDSPTEEDIYHTNEFRLTPPDDHTNHHTKSGPPRHHTNEFRLTPPDDHTNHHTKSGPPPAVAAQPQAQDGVAGAGESQEEAVNRRTVKPYLSILKRARRQSLMRRALLGLRISGFLFCLVSFSVMAADKKQGWTSDSFSNYKEFRYCLAVNVLGFVYSALQTYDLVNYFTTGKYVVQHHLRHYFDFLMDQILTYLVISASSSAATRVEDWESNWGKDKFPDMARASVALSFLAFFAFASSSLISGYTLCTLKSM